MRGGDGCDELCAGRFAVRPEGHAATSRVFQTSQSAAGSRMSLNRVNWTQCATYLY